MDELTILSSLPNELIVKICNNMDIITLEKFMINYIRGYELCFKILFDKIRELSVKYQVLTPESIKSLSKNIEPFVLDPISIAYIQILLVPYVKLLDTVTPGLIPSYFKWRGNDKLLVNCRWLTNPTCRWIYKGLIIPKNDLLHQGLFISTTMRDDGIVYAYQYVENFLSNNSNYDVNSPEAVIEAKNGFIKYIISKIFDLFTFNKQERVVDTYILPWDIKSTISSDSELSQMFNIKFNPWLSSRLHNRELNRLYNINKDDTLPVMITINNNPFGYKLSLDFITGLMLFSDISGYNFPITIFNIPFNLDYIKKNNSSRYIKEIISDRYNFTINIGDKGYKFNTLEFLQGFATGAFWSGVDHHLYWNHLRASALNLSEYPTGKYTFEY